jgi:hypothetical protein
LFVGVVALVLHPGGERHHSQVVRVGDVVDIAGQAHGELGHGNEQGVAAAGSRALHVHGRSARWLPDGAANVEASLPETFYQAERGSGLALSEGGRRHRCDLDVLAVRPVSKPIHDPDEIELGNPAVWGDLIPGQAEPLAPLVRRRQILLCCLSDLPGLRLGGVVGHSDLLGCYVSNLV